MIYKMCATIIKMSRTMPYKRTYKRAFPAGYYPETSSIRSFGSSKRIKLGSTNTRTGGFFKNKIYGRPQGPEWKTIDTGGANYVCDTTGSVTLLNGCATGTDFTDRIGRKSVFKTLQIRGMVHPVDNNSSNTTCRVVVVYDTQSNGAAPAITDVFKTVDGTAFTNLNNRDRFVILVDKQFAMGRVSDAATQAFGASPNAFKIQIYKKLNLETLYSGTTAAIASIQTGSIYLMTFGNQAVNDGGNFNGSFRLRFVDN